MSGKFPSRGDFEIPSELLDEHEWIADALIDDEIASICSLVFPPSDDECPNCLFDLSTGRSANIYKTGGPISFPNHTICPWCGGEGKLTQDVTVPIRLRVYFGGMEVNAAMRQFQNIEVGDHPDGLVYVIGYMNDLPNFRRANAIKIMTSVNIEEWKYERASEAIPWGFRKNRYFAAMLRRI